MLQTQDHAPSFPYQKIIISQVDFIQSAVLLEGGLNCTINRTHTEEMKRLNHD